VALKSLMLSALSTLLSRVEVIRAACCRQVGREKGRGTHST
jgi:hypothetical protein